MILNQPDFFARSATLDGAISDTDTQATLAGLSTRFTDAVTAGTVRYPIGPFRISDDDGFEIIAITGHVSGTTFTVERGIQGTTAEAWADGTAVRAVVTREQVYPRSYLSTQVIPPNDRIIFYDDFDREDGPLAGTEASSGQVWSPTSDPRFEIRSSRTVYRSGNGNRQALVPVDLSRPTYHYRCTVLRDTACGIVLASDGDASLLASIAGTNGGSSIHTLTTNGGSRDTVEFDITSSGANSNQGILELHASLLISGDTARVSVYGPGLSTATVNIDLTANAVAADAINNRTSCGIWSDGGFSEHQSLVVYQTERVDFFTG